VNMQAAPSPSRIPQHGCGAPADTRKPWLLHCWQPEQCGAVVSPRSRCDAPLSCRSIGLT
jgi:hypothetical protein